MEHNEQKTPTERVSIQEQQQDAKPEQQQAEQVAVTHGACTADSRKHRQP